MCINDILNLICIHLGMADISQGLFWVQFGTNLHYIWCQFNSSKNGARTVPSMVQFWTNLVSNISIKALYAIQNFFGVNKVRECKAHFVWAENRIYFEIFERKVVEIIVS